MKRIPNLETAIHICRTNKIHFNYELMKRNAHIKFYVDINPIPVIMSCKKDNYNKVKKEVEAIIQNIGRN